MKYCGECGHKNPENNRFCENCGAPLQNKTVSTRPSRKRSTRSPRKKRSGCWKYLVGIVVIIALALWGISRLGDGDADRGTLCEISLDEDNLVSDFQMSDIDWLIDYALNCELLDQEYIKVLSNGLHDGAFLSGIGEYSDESVFDEVLEDMMSKYDNYKEAFLRLEQLDLFSNGDDDLLSVTGIRGRQLLSATCVVAAAAGSGSVASWGSDKIKWLGAQITGAQKDHDQMLATLREMGAFKDQKMQKAIFECVNNTGGYKDAHSFFIALNNGEMPHLGANHLSQIRKNLEWIDGETHSKWVKAEETLKCHKTYEEHWCERGRELGNKGVELELKVLDKLTGGGISKVQKLEQYAQNIKKFKEVLFDGKKEKLTEEDIRMAMRKNGIDKLRKLMPKTGNDTADKVLNFICDKLQNEALREDPSGKIAGEKGLTLIDLMNGKGDLSKAVIVTGEDGRVQIVIPDGKGGGKTITVPGKKRISVVTKNGKRSKTAKVKTKKGKLSVGDKEKREEKKEDNPVSDMESQDAPPKGDHWKLVKREVYAENNGEVFRGTKMEGTYGRFHMKSQQLDDGQLYSPPDHKNCKGEYYDCVITYTEPKKYYTPNGIVESKVSSHSSHSTHICGVPDSHAGISARLLVGDGERWPKYPDLKNAKGEHSIYTQRLELSDRWAVKYQDFSDVVSTTIQRASSSDSIMIIEFYFAHGRGEDAIRISYTYHFVKEAEKNTKNESDGQGGGNGIQERKPEAVDGKNSLGITGNDENITINR